jgi:hypothetical protein
MFGLGIKGQQKRDGVFRTHHPFFVTALLLPELERQAYYKRLQNINDQKQNEYAEIHHPGLWHVLPNQLNGWIR